MQNLGPGDIIKLDDPIVFEVSIKRLFFREDGRTEYEQIYLQRVYDPTQINLAAVMKAGPALIIEEA